MPSTLFYGRASTFANAIALAHVRLTTSVPHRATVAQARPLFSKNAHIPSLPSPISLPQPSSTATQTALLPSMSTPQHLVQSLLLSFTHADARSLQPVVPEQFVAATVLYTYRPSRDEP
eukprot:TRINITY_DN10685_c0_g1_i1.p1 TRINITY_DN10685_c0_g1~~TRINITY_DN10685_c0_g1_i1.p1  ORF type:complete len:119 (+),score=11.16 TRINITY_DN10685_c0_g1_i1:176-532(+)